ncbi:MAG: DUF983 domain-containing protein [Crocinitomicaceae bacterium]|nr:DUF983 domain-containing protein [Crocinitomicaceae bacterium]MCF8434724.1 DUF983 domain-containing protein [Crocinitomicaceae bacterium]
MKKGTKIYSILNKKCPQCHEGDFFVSSIYVFKYMGDVKENCPHCGLKYSKEPGFFYGAMYVAYALGVATFVTLWVSFNLFFDNVSIGWQIGSIVTSIIILSPAIYAYSKIIWSNMFVKYKHNAKPKVIS